MLSIVRTLFSEMALVMYGTSITIHFFSGHVILKIRMETATSHSVRTVRYFTVLPVKKLRISNQESTGPLT